MTPRLASVSIDLDEIPCYAAIHGLPMPTGAPAHAVYDRAVQRFESLFGSEGIPATFFVIARDLKRERNRDTVKRLGLSGYEIGNHSLDHLYDLTRRDSDTIRTQITAAQEAIERACSMRPRGFRAPGYTITDDVFAVLQDAGLAWDSSVFPCPSYYAAKATALAWIRARGRQSRSILDRPQVLRSPVNPYRVGRPYWRTGDGMVELPVGVTRRARLPYIGTSLIAAGKRGTRWLSRQMTTLPFVNLLLHGIDLADADEDGLGFLKRHQPDLRRSATEKETILRTAIDTLRASGYRFVTLSEAAQAFG